MYKTLCANFIWLPWDARSCPYTVKKVCYAGAAPRFNPKGKLNFQKTKVSPGYGSMIVYTTIVLSFMQLRKLRSLANYVVYIVPRGANCSVA